ncbi:hypothetical protein EDB81DRAFT_774099 [Dactylonectria macrodidyma]|uniref:Uncharacterized protein n=1 Tax=Dactylonectria macrodidyma TaxID=307937 RepID=A0A9P9JG61_9HYPO|nr:hypothetical protein EDB81DRAFT_774099 [Dactylonectria macrodidyma]
MAGSSPTNPPQSPRSNIAEVTADAAPVEVDAPPADDGDSTFGSELSTYTASLTSSVINYPHEFGRRYHAYNAGCKTFAVTSINC